MRREAEKPGRLVVRRLTDGDADRWDRFVNGCPEATFFHRAGWRQVLEEGFGHRAHYLYVEADGVIHGVLPLGHIRSRLFGSALISVPFCVYGGVVAPDPGVARMLTEAARDLAEELRVEYLELRSRRPVNPEWPQRDDLYVTFRKPIAPEVEENLLAIPRKQRAMVRKGEKNGLRSDTETGVERFFPIYAESVRRLGTPVFARRYFALLRQVFGEACEVLVVHREGRPLAAVLSFYFRDEVLPYYGGGTLEARSVAGYDFLYWELMRRACERGFRIFDYGRSKRGTGAFHFKKNWGFTPEPLHYAYHLVRAGTVPDRNPLNPRYRMLIAAWKRLPLPVANTLGPMVARGLG